MRGCGDPWRWHPGARTSTTHDGMTAPLRVLLADDHPVFRKRLSALLTSLTDTTVVGEAANGEQAVALAASTTPDVIVMDLNMPDMNGVEATRHILAKPAEHRRAGADHVRGRRVGLCRHESRGPRLSPQGRRHRRRCRSD